MQLQEHRIFSGGSILILRLSSYTSKLIVFLKQLRTILKFKNLIFVVHWYEIAENGKVCNYLNS